MLGRTLLPRFITTALVLAGTLAGCTSDDVTAPPGADEGAMTVDASNGWVYVSLADSAVVVPSASPTASADWDVAFNATGVMLNGGEAGPGGVTGACLCQNASATSAQILAMTPASEEADFESVASIPAGASFMSETFVPVLTGWFSGNGAAAAADPSTVHLIRLDDGTSFAKMHVTALTNPTSGNAGTVVLEYAVQPSETAALGAVQTLAVDVSAGSQQVDLNTGTTGASVAGWDLEIDGFAIRLNGGASGSGQAGVSLASEPFADVTTAATHASAYQTDAFAGVFNAHRWYRYDLAGDRRVSPTFDVYLVRRGSVTYALQILDYYGPTGLPRQISFRYRRIGS
jgi:hypothetical protein